MVLFLLTLSSAHAARDRALLYMGHSAPLEYNWGDGSLDDLVSGMRRMGAEVDQETVWPGELDDYALVVLFLSQNTYSAAERAELTAVTDAGGLVVLVTDNADFVPYTEGIFNNLLSSVGRTARFNDWQYIGGYDGACRTDSAAVEDHLLTRGQPQLQYALAVHADDGGGTRLYSSGFVVLDGPWLLIADVNVLHGGCDGELVDNGPFFENLWIYAYGGTCQQTDRDGDGHDTVQCGGDDCDDTDDQVNPDEVRYEDADGDGHGNPDARADACSAPASWVVEGDDCVDTDAATLGDAGPFYTDADGDGFGDPDSPAFACALEAGLSESDEDCDDDDDDVNPDADETCDGRDEDCDGDVDDDAVDALEWYYDGDGDGYGDPDEVEAACEEPEGYVDDASDCADGDPTTYPGSPTYEEVCGKLIAGDSAATPAAGCFCDGLGAALGLPALVGFARRRRTRAEAEPAPR